MANGSPQSTMGVVVGRGQAGTAPESGGANLSPLALRLVRIFLESGVISSALPDLPSPSANEQDCSSISSSRICSFKGVSGLSHRHRAPEDMAEPHGIPNLLVLKACLKCGQACSWLEDAFQQGLLPTPTHASRPLGDQGHRPHLLLGSFLTGEVSEEAPLCRRKVKFQINS